MLLLGLQNACHERVYVRVQLAKPQNVASKIDKSLGQLLLVVDLNICVRISVSGSHLIDSHIRRSTDDTGLKFVSESIFNRPLFTNCALIHEVG